MRRLIDQSEPQEPLHYKRYEFVDGINYNLLMQRVLLALALATTEARSSRLDGNSHGTGVSRPVENTAFSPGEADHHEFYRRYVRARTIMAKRVVVRAALERLRGIRYAKRAKIDLQTKEGRIALGRMTQGRDKRGVRLLAAQFGYSWQHLYKLRAEAEKAESVLTPS